MSTTSIRLERGHRSRTNTFVCDGCREPIMDKRFLRLLRSRNTLPEDSTVFKLHRKCVGEFVASHSGGWDAYALDSPEAKWLLPLDE